jgi:hypothetical protein
MYKVSKKKLKEMYEEWYAYVNANI